VTVIALSDLAQENKPQAAEQHHGAAKCPVGPDGVEDGDPAARDPQRDREKVNEGEDIAKRVLPKCSRAQLEFHASNATDEATLEGPIRPTWTGVNTRSPDSLECGSTAHNAAIADVVGTASAVVCGSMG
jgi:hypothetical protein